MVVEEVGREGGGGVLTGDGGRGAGEGGGGGGRGAGPEGGKGRRHVRIWHALAQQQRPKDFDVHLDLDLLAVRVPP